MKIFSERLKWLREKKGYSQREIAEKLGVSQPYYLKFEKDKGEPNLETLVKLPDILGESLDFLTGVSDLDRYGSNLFGDFGRLILSITHYEREIESFLTDPPNLGWIESNKTRIKLYRTQMGITRDKILKHLETIPLVQEKTYQMLEDYEKGPIIN